MQPPSEKEMDDISDGDVEAGLLMEGPAEDVNMQAELQSIPTSTVTSLLRHRQSEVLKYIQNKGMHKLAEFEVEVRRSNGDAAQGRCPVSDVLGHGSVGSPDNDATSKNSLFASPPSPPLRKTWYTLPSRMAPC